MSAIGYAMGYLAHLQQVEKRVDGILIQGSYSPSDDEYRWFLPDLPQGVKTPVEQVFRSPENVVKFYRHYENIIRAKQAEFSILEKEAEALTTAIGMDKNNYWREEKVFPALVLRHMGSGNDYFPDRNCKPEEFVIKLELVWCCNGFRHDTPDECVEGVVNEAIKRGINPLFLKRWIGDNQKLIGARKYHQELQELQQSLQVIRQEKANCLTQEKALNMSDKPKTKAIRQTIEGLICRQKDLSEEEKQIRERLDSLKWE